MFDRIHHLNHSRTEAMEKRRHDYAYFLSILVQTLAARTFTATQVNSSSTEHCERSFFDRF
jgi:hypothetical protein